MQITPLDDDSSTVSALPYAPEESIQPKWAFFRTLLGEGLARPHGEVLRQRTQRQDWEEGQRANDQHGARQHAAEQASVGRMVPTVIGTSFLAAIEPASASIKTIDT